MILWSETQVTEETLELAQEVYQDFEQLRPNVVLDTLKGWIPGLTRLGYRILMAALILIIGFRIARIVQKMIGRSFKVLVSPFIEASDII